MDVPALLARVSDSGLSASEGMSVEVATGRPARGRLFQPIAETQLQPALRHLAHKLPGAARGLLLVPELVGPYGVVDLLAVTYIGDRVVRRWGSGVPPILSEIDAQVLAAANHRPKSLERLAQSTRRSQAALRRRLRDLVALGAMRVTEQGYTRAEAIQPIGRFWALEAKVDDWRRGLGQATQYGLWADASAVILGRLSTDASYLIGEAQRLNIGLAVESKWLVRPRIQKHAEFRRLWASEHVFAALVDSPTWATRFIDD